MKRFLFAVLTLLSLNAYSISAAQTPEQPSPAVQMADALREDGKIYVVVLVVVILFTFMLAYLVLTDRQVKKLEKEVRDLKRGTGV